MTALHDNPQKRVSELSVVVVFFNMRREAARTLYSLSRAYQEIPNNVDYDVCAIDNGSSQPLDKELVQSFGDEFHYHFISEAERSPCSVINQSVLSARYANVMVLIDGARILSPGIVRQTLLSLEALAHPFVYTFGMHLGSKPQNYLVTEGYNQSQEDALLERTDWKARPYSLFPISSPALSSKRGFFSRISESNCFTLRKQDFVKAGLYDLRFRSAGGVLCNLELFNRLNRCEWIQPVMILGEATFHQFHGGVATNAPIKSHPWEAMAKEYFEIFGEPYENKFRPPLYLGSFREECAFLYEAADRMEEEARLR